MNYIRTAQKRARSGIFALAAIVALALACSIGASAAGARSLYVSVRARKTGHQCTAARPCRSIASALARAHKGEAILVSRGTYREELKVTKDVEIVGVGAPTLEANGHTNGVLISGVAADGTIVRGLIVRNALEEGILAEDTSGVRVEKNTVTGNDRGGGAAKPEGQCAPEGPTPGDCGEGLHLRSVTDSKVARNLVENNAGGILLTDETGPTAHNVIIDNKALNNVLDCGITLAGHNPKAAVLSSAPVPSVTGLAPTVGGVYDNVITNNTSNGNGIKGEGAGILMAGGPPGIAVYDNTVRDNVAEGNGLAGVTIHSHAPGQDLNGNVIINNVISHDGLAGYQSGAPGDSDAGVTQTVGVLVWSAVTPLSGITVAGNQISNDYYGIWTKNVPPIKLSANTFASTVTVPLTQS